jgi:hypothetical protein
VKRKKKIENPPAEETKYLPPTVFEVTMNLQCDLRAELDLSPLTHWQQTRKTPHWSKNICQNLGKTILKPIKKLRPVVAGTVNWRHYGRLIGIGARCVTFFKHDVPRMMEKDFGDVSEERWQRIESKLGLDDARQYCLKVLERPADDTIFDDDLFDLLVEKQFARLEQIKQTAFALVAAQSAEISDLFFKGMSEGYTTFLNNAGEFSGDDRRADIHFELLGWQFNIEKMRRSVIPKNNNHLIVELKKLEEFKNKSGDWFKDVFKDIKLSIGRRGRPLKFAQA